MLFIEFKSVKDTSRFSKDFIENCYEDIDEGRYLEVDMQYFEKLHDHQMIYSFYRRE